MKLSVNDVRQVARLAALRLSEAEESALKLQLEEVLNAVAGRVWCGYLCPQTVWTDLFQTIERWVEGDRREHLQRDSQPWTIERLWRSGRATGRRLRRRRRRPTRSRAR